VTLSTPPADRRTRWLGRARTFGLCVAAGASLCLSIPPFGWWPLAFVGIAVWSHLLADMSPTARFRRSWLVALAWLAPAMVWMVDLTAPGYVIAAVVYAAYFGLAGLACPPGRARWLALPGALILAEWARWVFPFGGVPLATLAMSQAAAPLAQSARLFGPLFVGLLVCVGGVALAAAAERAWKPAAIGAAVLVVSVLVALVAPRGQAQGTFTVAVVQGGGPQRTRAATSDSLAVTRRHLEATQSITEPVDLIVWPENVVSVDGPLDGSYEDQELRKAAQAAGVPIVVGFTEDLDEYRFMNASVVYLPDGTRGDRYDKVRRVPFGEYVPLRSFIEKVAPNSGLPGRDAVPGTGPAVIDTPVGPMGIVISWEVFFDNRARDAIGNGGEALLNPTNGASYWLTQVQSQQVASSQLRAIETGRWVMQAAPTGFSAIVEPNGTVDQRTGLKEQAVLVQEVERRTGQTISTQVGRIPVLLVSLALVAAGWYLTRRHQRGDETSVPDQPVNLG
jgi:apolipoprotein N-acyltransferase